MKAGERFRSMAETSVGNSMLFGRSVKDVGMTDSLETVGSEMGL